MRIVRSALLAVSLMGLAAACGGSKKEDTTPAATEVPATEMPAEPTPEAPPADPAAPPADPAAPAPTEGGGW